MELLKQYNKLEDNNDHNDAAILLIKAFGTEKELEEMEEIKYNHEKRGHILYDETQTRYNMTKKYYKLLHKLNNYDN